MKAITIKQPWASLIVEEIKDVENRTWRTNFRGRILIHAAAKPASIKIEIEGQATCKEITILSTLNRAEEDNLFGCIIGSVEIVDCVQNHPSIWAEKGVWNWLLQNPIKFDVPIKCKGKLSLWDYPYILAEAGEKDGEPFCHCKL